MLLPSSSEGDKLHETLLTDADMYQKEMANYRELVNNQYRYRGDLEDSLGIPRDNSGVDLMEVYAIRWFILILFVCSSIANGLILLTWSVIQESACDYFGGAHNYTINAMTATFQICYIPGTFLCFRVLDYCNCNLRFAMLVAGTMNTLGCVIRIVGAAFVHDIDIDACYWIIVIGTMVCSLALPFYWIIPAKLAGTWFAISERDAILTFGVLSCPFGNALGAILPPFFINEKDSGTTLNKGVDKLLLLQGAISAIALIMLYMGFQSQPKNPPSKAAALIRVIESDRANGEHEKWGESFSRHLTTLFSDSNYRILLVSFCVCVGHLYSLTALVYNLPGVNSDEDYGFICVLISTFGLISAFVSGLILNCTLAYRSFYKCIYLLAIGGWLFFFSQCKDNNSTYLFISSAVLGTLLLPTIPAIIINVAESTYPIPEDISLGCLYMTSNGCSILFMFIGEGLFSFDIIDSNAGIFPYSIWLLASMGIFIPSVLYYNGDYLRSNLDRNLRMALD